MTDINDVYRQRNNLAVAFCKAALAAGWPAGRGVDDTKEPDDEWRHVVYVDLPSGDQVSWHMAPCAVHLLEGLPEYKGKWEGTFTARHKNWPLLIDTKDLPHDFNVDVILPAPADPSWAKEVMVSFDAAEGNGRVWISENAGDEMIAIEGNENCRTLARLLNEWAGPDER